MRFQHLVVILATLITASACDSRTSPPAGHELEAALSGNGKAIVDRFQSRLLALVNEHDVPSLSAAIVQSDGTVNFLSFGTLERGKDRAVFEDTIFQIASLSKLLTGIVTNSLARSGELDLDATVKEHLAAFLTAKTSPQFNVMSMRQLLNHRAGVANEDCSLYANREDGEPWLDGYSRGELIADVRKIAKSDRLSSGFDYSSCGYAIVGLIDEVVSGQPFSVLLKNHVTEIYGMTDTAVTLDPDQASRLAIPYRKDDRRSRTRASQMGMGTPASAIYSTTRDLVGLQVAQLAAYRDYIVDGRDSNLILSQQTEVGQRENIRFGTGIIELHHDAGTILLHDGDADGFASLYAFAPVQNVGIVMLTGSGGNFFVETGMELLVALMAAENASALQQQGR